MNFQTAAVAGGIAFLLSFVAGLIGGVSFIDLAVRALFWGAVGFGGCLGAEALLRSLVPDLFVPREPDEEEPAAEPDRRVDITLEDEAPARGGFVEEVDEDLPPVPRAFAETPPPPAAGSDGPAAFSGRAPAAGPGPGAPAEAEEEMPEIGSFLDAFKPGAPDAEAGDPGPAPEIGEYAPVDSPVPSRSGSEVTIDGETQDPAVLAKAVQTVMKRDAQGN